MGYNVTKNDKDGIKVYVPSFYNIVKITDKDNNITYKPQFALTEKEKKIYKDKEDNRIVFYKQKLGGFMIGNVFDVKDTDMPFDLIELELNPIIYDRKAEELMECFIKTIYNDGFKVSFVDLKGDMKGYCNHQNNQIVVKKDMGSLIQMKVLIHEYAHALAHKHLKNNNRDYKEHRNQYETEAESIAYVVSKYLDIPTTDYSLTYLYAWSKNKDFKEIDESLNTIVNYSRKIINNFEKFYDREFGLYSEDYKKINI